MTAPETISAGVDTEIPFGEVSHTGPSSPLSLTHKTASGFAWMSLAQVVRQLLQLLSVSILARHIAPSAYGLVAMAALITNFMETVRDVGIGYALVRERVVSREFASTVFWLNCIFGGTATLLVVAASWPAAYFFREKQLVLVLQLLAVSFFLGALAVVPTAMLNRAMQFRKVAIAQTSGFVIGAAVAISMAVNGKGVWSLVAANVANSATTTILMWLLSPLQVGFAFRRCDIRRVLHFGLNLTGFHVLNYVSRNTDNLLVGRFLGSAPLGYYQMGYMLMTYPLTNFASIVSQVVYPALASVRDQEERFRAAFLRACRLTALVTFPLMLGLAVTAGPFTRVLLGPRWMPVSPLLVIFGPLGAMQSIYTMTGLIYNTTGRTDIQFRWSMLCSTMYVVSFVIGLRWGILGVAGCYAIAWTLLMVPSFYIPLRLVRLSPAELARVVWPTVACSLVMVVVAGGCRVALLVIGMRNAFMEFVVTVTVGAATYLTLLWWRRPPVLEEVSTLFAGSSNSFVKLVGRLMRPK
jgi:PST family polysaccharide transporter